MYNTISSHYLYRHYKGISELVLFLRPAPRVTWKKVGGALPGGRFDDQLEDGTMLRISDVRWEDEAEYVCTGTNSQGSKTYTISVDVQCKIAIGCVYHEMVDFLYLLIHFTRKMYEDGRNSLP